jgi:hypothetical protein
MVRGLEGELDAVEAVVGAGLVDAEAVHGGSPRDGRRLGSLRYEQ